MSVRQLVDLIEKMNVVDDRLLQRIRREIDDPEKNVKSKSILSFLVKKEQLTKKQAAKLLKESQQQVPVDTIEVKPEPKNVHDTDALIGVSPEEIVNDNDEVEVEVEPIEVEVEEVEVDVEPVVEVSVEPEVSVDIETEVAIDEHVPVAPLPEVADPLALGTGDQLDPMSAGLGSSGLEPSQPPRERGTGKGFQSKRENRDQWSSKWVYIGTAILGSILILLAVLWLAVGRQNLEALQEKAEESFTTGAYSDAVAKTEELLELSPRHENAEKWKVRIVHCQLAQPFESKRYEEVLKVAEEHLPAISELEAFAELREDLARLILPSTAEALTTAAKGKAAKVGTTVDEMQSELLIAQRAEALVDNTLYMPGSIRKMDIVAKQLDAIEDNVRGIENSIKKETNFKAAKVEIQQLTKESKTDAAFSVFNDLTKNYPDLGAREDLQTLMRNVSVKERELVKPAGMQLVGEQSEPASIFSAQVVTARRQGDPMSEFSGETIPVLTEGVLYGYEAGEGTVLWNRFMGFETHYPPQWADQDNRSELIVSDQKNNTVMKLNAKDGSLVWKTEIKQPFANPTITAGKVIITTESGILIGLDGTTGSTYASVQLPQKTNVSAGASTRYPYIYQPGDYSNLYVLDAETLECLEVVYTGHSPGSMTVPVFDWSGYITVLINQADYCDMRLYRPSGAEGVAPGLGLQQTQVILRLTNGHISTPLLKMGRTRYLAVSDAGNMNLLEMNKVENPEQPVSAIAQQDFQVRKGEKNFLQTKSTRLWIGSRGIERYKVSAVGEFKREPIASQGDFVLGPMTKIEDKLFHLRRRSRSALSSITAADVQSMDEIWRSDLGAAFAGPPREVDGKIQLISSQGDLFLVEQSAFSSGYTDQSVWSTDDAENLQFDRSIMLGNGSYVSLGAAGSPDILLVRTNGTTRLGRLQSPADSPSCPIIGLGDNLLVASTKGQVVLINPENGLTVGSPFQPRKTPGVDTLWRQPAIVGENQVVVGKDDGSIYQLASDGRQLKLVAEFQASGGLESGLVAVGSVAYGVTKDGAKSHLVGFKTEGGLSEAGKVAINGNLIAGPWHTDGMLMFVDDFGTLQAYSTELNGDAVWSIDLGTDTLAAEPMASKGVVLLAMKSGRMMLVDGKSGETQKEIEIGQPIMHAPLFSSGNIYIGSADGRLLVLPGSVF